MDMAKPKIRFKGYTDDWEQRKFGDLVEKYEDPIDTPTDGYMRLGIRSHAKGTFHNYVEKGKELETAKMFRVAANNFIVNITFGWEHAVAITDESDAGKLVSHRFPQYSFENGMIPMFFKYLILDENFKHHLELSSPGGAGRNRVLKLNDMLEYKMKFPCEDEQRKLASYFDDLDHLITLHHRKCEETKKLKKYMLQKMFPQNGQTVPEIRFAGFTDAWEQRKWIDTVDISTEMVDPTTGEYDDMPHIAPGNIESFTGRILDNVKTVKEEQLISGKFRFRPNDVVYGKINPQLGKCFYASVDGLTSADAYVFNGKNGITQKFLYSVLQTNDFFKYSVSVSRRSGMPKINRDELNAYSFWAPREEEQERIGDFLLGIENLITLHQRKNIYF